MSLDRRHLIMLATDLAKQLSSFRSPGSQNPVDANMLGVVLRFVNAQAKSAPVELFLRTYPSTSWAQYTRSRGPQTEYLCKNLLRLSARLKRDVGEDRYIEALGYVLGQTRRLMQINKDAAPQKRSSHRDRRR